MDHTPSRDKTEKDEATAQWLRTTLEESNAIFAEMSDGAQAALASAMFLLHVAPGETLIEQGSGTPC